MLRYEELNEKMGAPDADFEKILEEQQPLLDQIEAADAWELDSKIEQAMDALRCPPPDEPVVHLSGGERRRVALCKLLLEAPDLLLLDEPTNHLDAESVLWLERHLAQYAGAVLAVTHDRYFLDNVAQWILELDRGRAYPYEGNYSTYLEKKAERLAVQGKKDQKLQKRLKDELEWVRQNAKGRQTKSKSRLARYEEMAAEAEKNKKLDFEEIQIPAGPRLGNVVIEAQDLQKGFGDRVLIDGLSFSLPRGGIVGIIGRTASARPRCSRRSSGWSRRRRRGPRRRDRADQLRRPEPHRHRPEEDRVGGRVRGARLHPGRAAGDAEPRLHRRLRLQGPRPAEAGRRAVRRRAQPPQPGDDAQAGRQRAAARRAHQRPRHRDAELAGERAARVPRLRRRHQPRPLVPRPHRHPHPGVGGRRARPAKWYWFEGNFESYEKNKVERLGADAARPHRVTHRKLTRD
jgi:ABC-type multidrug transport system ATPase subunit